MKFWKYESGTRESLHEDTVEDLVLPQFLTAKQNEIKFDIKIVWDSTGGHIR